MENEVWKDIENYEGLYQVSNYGKVKSLKYGKEKILKLQKDDKNYLFVILYKNGKGKKYWVDKLVAKAFIPNPENIFIVRHKDENSLNNNADNLEWFSVIQKWFYANKEVDENV